MPTAPPIRRPPVRTPPTGGAGIINPRNHGGFARPPRPDQQPGGNAQSILNAAINRSKLSGADNPNQPNNKTGTFTPRTPTNTVAATPARTSPPQPAGPGTNQPSTHINPNGSSTSGTGAAFPAPPSSAQRASGGAPVSGPNNAAGAQIQAPNGPTVPDTTPTYNIPLVPADEAAKAQATTDYNAVSSNELEAIQNAAMKYGDTGLMQQWGLNAAPNPNSQLALAALKAQQQQQAAENARGRAGTFFSSLMGQDLSNISNAQQRADLAGYQNYQTALANFNRLMTQALDTETNRVNAANADERQSALNTMPTAQGTGSGNFEGGSSANVTGKVQGSSKTTTTKPKGGTIKPPKLPKVTKPGKPSKTRVSTGKGKVGSVKPAQRVPGKRR